MPNERKARSEKEIAALLAQAWPKGMIRSDATLLKVLSEEDREKALDRLEAMLAADDEVSPRAKLASALGINRSFFHKLYKRWEADRRLAALVPYESRAPRRTARNRENELLERTVRRLLLRSPAGARNVDVAEAAAIWEQRRRLRHRRMRGEDLASQIDVIAPERTRVSAALTTVHTVRRSLATDVEWLKTHYGEALVVDLTAISLAIDDGGRHTQVVAALVIEAASGFVLGSALGAFETAFELEIEAIEDALCRLRSTKIDVCDASSGPVSISAVVGGDFAVGVAAAPARARNASRADVVQAPGHLELQRGTARRYGLLAFQRIGHRVGRIHLHPRSTYSGDAEVDLASRKYSIVARDEAQATWRHEVERHNHPIEQRLKGFDRLCVGGNLAKGLDELIATLQSGASSATADSAATNDPR